MNIVERERDRYIYMYIDAELLHAPDILREIFLP